MQKRALTEVEKRVDLVDEADDASSFGLDVLEERLEALLELPSDPSTREKGR